MDVGPGKSGAQRLDQLFTQFGFACVRIGRVALLNDCVETLARVVPGLGMRVDIEVITATRAL
ncbi:hypothetical protein CES87_25550 [Pseudomonas sp. ERMR1:02]|nr:hypothetical protein CES87_25550 [Pseudomonas sp. ERMR1:02]